MFQLRRILLSGLVALLMVGMVTASEVTSTSADMDETSSIGVYMGSRVGTACMDTSASDCIKFWFDIDVSNLLNIFK